MKNCNTFYKVQKTSRLNEIIQPPRTYLPSDKILLYLFSLRFTETNERLLSKYFKNAIFGVKKLWSENVFSDTKQKHVYWKIFNKLRKILTVLQDILFSMWVEVRKGVRFFERNCIVNWVIFFGRFCWLLHFLDKWNSEYVHWNVLHARKNIFKKTNFKYEILNHLYFGSNFVFWWTALGRFSQCFAFVQFFNVAPPPPPTPTPRHKNVSCGPVYSS